MYDVLECNRTELFQMALLKGAPSGISSVLLHSKTSYIGSNRL